MKKLLLPLLLLLAFNDAYAQVFPNGGWFTKTAMPGGRWAYGQTSYQAGNYPDTAKLFVISGADATFNLTTTSNVFNTATNVWSTIANIPSSRYQQQAFYRNGKVYFIGGYIGGQTATNAVNIYDIAGNSWTTGANMPTSVGDYGGVINGDYIYIICGRNGNTEYNSVQVYNIPGNSWSTATTFPGVAGGGGRAGVCRNKIVYVGGYSLALGATQSQAYMGTIDAVNPNTITWTALPNYPGGTTGRHAAGSIDGRAATKVYFTGGDPNGTAVTGLATTYAYDVVANQWESGPNKPTGVNNITALSPLIVNDTLFFACEGGYNGATVTAVNEWLKIGLARSPHTVITGADSICSNTSVTLTASGTGTSQQWQTSNDNINFSFIPAATTNSYTTPVLSQTTYYRYVTYALLDSFISPTFTVTVADSIIINSQPSSVTACHGSAASFSVSASGTNPAYQWYVNGSPVPNNGNYIGGNSPTLSIISTTGLSGNTYNVVISNACNTVTSNTVTLTETLNNIWNGSVSTAWSNPLNWGCGIPDITTNVEIPASAPNQPLVDIPDAICKSITIHTGASLAFTGVGNALEINTFIAPDGTFDPSLGKIILSGTVTQYVPGVTYKYLDPRGGSTKILSGDATVTDVLGLQLGNIMLNKHNLTLQDPGAITGANDASFIVTNDSGRVIAQSLGTGGNSGPVVLPVGRDGRSLTPITLQNSGALDTFSVRVSYDVYEDGYGLGFQPPTVISPVVNRTWVVSENTPGGSNVNMTLQWRDTNQINGFTTSHVYIGQFTNGQWFSLGGPSASAPPAAGSNPYSTSASNIQSFTLFTAASSGAYPLASQVLNSVVFNIDAYPNPAMSYITLNIDGDIAGKATLTVTDIAGRTIRSAEVKDKKVIVDIGALAPGMYFIKYADAARQEVIKFNKQ